MTLDQLIHQLRTLRAEHGGDISVVVTDGYEDTEVVEGMVAAHVALVDRCLMIDLTASPVESE